MKSRLIYLRPAFTLHLCAAGRTETYLTAAVKGSPSDPAQIAAEIYQALAVHLRQQDLQIVQERIFGSLDLQAQVLAARRDVLGRNGLGQDQPVTYVEGQPIEGKGLAGIQMHAVSLAKSHEKIWTLYDGALACGRGWTRHGMTFLLLQNLHGLPANPAGPAGKKEQVEAMFDRADRLLRQSGADYHNVVRTWIYLSDILYWYPEFNEVRNAKYSQWGLMPAPNEPPGVHELRLPASTGIRGDNPLGAACVMDLLAIKGNSEGQPEITQMTNLKQQDAFRYHRAFSRGACIRDQDGACVQVSGTAAIDEQGQSLFQDDARAQICRTLETIEALLAPVNAGLKHTCSATVFLKRPEDAAIYQRIAAEQGLSELPAVYMVADVCRPELLFEMDAVVAVP
jgi:enamine deaminase RidA (YjgF/YER057c/UK114 family)